MSSIPLRLARSLQGSENESILSRIGRTPLFRLERIDRAFPNVSIYAKAEWLNPGGSVKDRPALRMILAAEQDGRLKPGMTILDATSGNTGIGYAMIGAARGYPVRLALPANASPERIRILEAYGAGLTLTDPALGSDGAIEAAGRIAAAEPERYAYLNQYDNDDNWRAHYESTAPEIWNQTAGCLTHFVAALGTSGTFTGTARRLRELNPAIRAISVQPDAPFHGLEGMKHMPTARVPGIYDPSLADENIEIQTETAHRAVKRLIREEGMLVGVSSGAAIAACIEVARSIPRERHAMIVTIFADNGEKYLSERFWEETPEAVADEAAAPSLAHLEDTP
ncbi:MAG: cysteine synthase family protein [Candidatus Krumholzibacteria bacterium]|nr:cysteine synthase family protein [Candidatus Krumholzibacteria bacterium]MDH4337894.1 cysteine synthase family protein [Candidatus Krumholzibacteria bacterium]MDH5270221.1 cysteine synthase family protein [Candidatus Krumholzibacteria bacterium]MDH5627705.1 cysteine synthase family protein [Candidatus Krumholzibacteria bacterium]